jgi:hypothetical protein
MSAVQFGVATSALPEDLCSSYCHGNQPSFSYIYHSQERNNYRFELDDSEIDEFSFIPPIEIIGQKVCFTHNRQPVLYDSPLFILFLTCSKKLGFQKPWTPNYSIKLPPLPTIWLEA